MVNVDMSSIEKSVEKKFSGIFATLFLFFLFGTAFAQGNSELKAFPPAEEEMARFVIELPEKSREEEEDYRVELIAGRMMETDGVNTYRLGNVIEPRNLEGWGYTYYEVTGPRQAASTLMAVPEGAEPVRRFVAAPSRLIRYNSRLPVVVYAPEEYEVRYRIWSAGEKSHTAERK